MTLGLLLASAASGAAYTLAPGPAFLALLGIGAARGRRAGAFFLIGHFAGDILWASLSLIAILGAHTIGTLVFDLLGLVCGIYLGTLGLGALTVRRDGHATEAHQPRHPLLRGLAFGLSNPKAYPVAIAMFTALLAEHADALGWDAFVPLLAAACGGFIIADLLLIAVIGAGPVRRFHARHGLWVTRVSGVLFMGFALHALSASIPALRARIFQD